MYGDPTGIVIVAVIVFLLMTAALAYVIKRVMNRRNKAKRPPSRTVPAKDRPDELRNTTYSDKQTKLNRPESEVQKPLDEPLSGFEREQFHQDVATFLRENPPK